MSMKIWSINIAKDYDRLWIFGYVAYYHVHEDKLSSWSKKAIFLGFRPGVKNYKLWDPKDRKIVVSKDAIFNENLMLKFENPEKV